MASKLMIKIGEWEKELFDDYYYDYNKATSFEEFMKDWLFHKSDFDCCSNCNQYRTVDKWIEYDNYGFTSDLVEYYDIETEVNNIIIRDWLVELIDQELFATCDYSEELDAYDQSDRIHCLYEVVEKLCDMVECGVSLAYFQKPIEFSNHIQHLKREDIDKAHLHKVYLEIDRVRREHDHRLLLELIDKLTVNSPDKIYFKLI